MSGTNNQRGGDSAAVSTATVAAAAQLLIALAGDANWHIWMPPAGPHKYTRVYRPILIPSMTRHLLGQATIGATLHYADGETRALAWDVDDAAEWQMLEQAAQVLVESGARPLLVRSPAGRGGHLWLIFREAVPRTWARDTAYRYAPALADLAEHWPQDQPSQAIRLPGGFYRTAARGDLVEGWCAVALIEADRPPVYVSGPRVAPVLLRGQTPPTWVTPLALAPSRHDPAPPLISPPPRWLSRVDARPVCRQDRPLPAAAHDPRWLQAIGTRRHSLYFWFTDHDAATWYNAQHPAQELLPPDSNGYGRASWRNERTASVAYRPDGGWVDMGQGGRRSDGSRDGGDPLDLYCRLHRVSRDAALRQLARDLIMAALTELEAAAATGRAPAAWCARLTSPAGWRRYDSLRHHSPAYPLGNSPAERSEPNEEASPAASPKR